MKKLFFLCRIFVFYILLFNLSSCNNSIESSSIKPLNIVVQPFDDFSKLQLDFVVSELKKIYPNVLINEPIPLPTQAFYKPFSRYRADTLISFLRMKYATQGVILGVTDKDISVTKGEYKDWGVIGYGYCPGKACMISTFRLNKKQLKEQLFRSALHELGHNFGLPHCTNLKCLMRDFEGKNRMNELHEFCNSCKIHLNNYGWRIEENYF